MSESGVLERTHATGRKAALRGEAVTKAFQGVHAVNGATFDVPEGHLAVTVSRDNR
jgi:ABC-type branched-subunit amino acid transport system ATPase component